MTQTPQEINKELDNKLAKHISDIVWEVTDGGQRIEPIRFLSYQDEPVGSFEELKKYLFELKSLWQKEAREEIIEKIKNYQYGFIRDDGTGEPERAPEWQVIEDFINSLK